MVCLNATHTPASREILTPWTQTKRLRVAQRVDAQGHPPAGTFELMSDDVAEMAHLRIAIEAKRQKRGRPQDDNILIRNQSACVLRDTYR